MNRKRDTHLSRITFTAAAMLFLPGTGLTLHAQPLGNGDAVRADVIRKAMGLSGNAQPKVSLVPQVNFQRLYINGKPVFLGILDRKTGLAILKNEWPDQPPVLGRVTATAVEAYGMVAPILKRGDGTVSIRWPAGPGSWESKEPVYLSTDAQPGLPPVPQPNFHRYWINGHSVFLCVLDPSTGLAILKNEWPDQPPVFGRVTATAVEAYGMVAPIVIKGGSSIIRWPSGPGFWQKATDVVGTFTITKNGIMEQTKVSELPNGQIMLTNEAGNSSGGDFSDATKMVLHNWKDQRGNNLTVSIDDNGDVQMLTFSNGDRWVRLSPTH